MGIKYGVLTTAIDGQGFAQVSFSDAARLVYFDPLRFAAPWPVPAVADRVAVAPGTPQWVCLWAIGAGTATYEYSGAD